MNKDLKKVLFSLILHAIDKKEVEENVKNLIKDESLLRSVYSIAKGHDVAHLVAYALDNLGYIDKETEIGKKFLKQQTMAIFRCEQILLELENVCKTFEETKIAFIPLKGSVIRNLYPEPWMRTSCDIDILVHEEDLSRAIEVLKQKLNFSTDGIRSSHDVSLFSELGVHIELHFDLTEGEKAGCLSDVWTYSEVKKGYKYWRQLQPSVFYFYHIKHMVKHFEAGGCGIKPFIDLYVMQGVQIREGSLLLIKEEGLEKFESAVYNLERVWFNGEEEDELSLELEAYICDGGVYGSVENRVLTQQAKQGGKIKYILSRIFIPYSQLVIKYPSLKKCPILFPFYQVRRWFNLLFAKGRGKKSIQELNATTSVSKTLSKRQENLLERLGLKIK